MATNFKLTAKARTLSLKRVFSMGETKAYALFCELRWPETKGEAVCPKCGGVDPYKITTRRKFKCRACHHQFSVTSGTIFASRKLSFTDILGAIAIISNAAKGVSAMQLSRDLDVQHKTAWVLSHKIREAMSSETAGETLFGIVEVDGAWFGGSVKPANKVEDRKDRRLKANQTGKRRSVVVMRERRGRTLTTVVKHESDGIETIFETVKPGSEIHADEATHWDVLATKFPTKRINHSIAYSEHGKHTNMAESYFSRLRLMVAGQHHHVSAHHLGAYARHAAFLEDHRGKDNGAMTKHIIGLGLAAPVSRDWKGYWQRHVSVKP